MSELEPRTHLAEVVRNEVLPGQPGGPSVRHMALWAPAVNQCFEFSLYAVPSEEKDSALEEEFPLGSKVLLTENGGRLLQVKRLVSSQ